MSFTAKSVIFDFADNWGDDEYMCVREIDFYYQESKLALTPSDYTAYATSSRFSGWEAYAFDTSGSLVDGVSSNEWRSNTGNITNQRLIVVFNSEQTFDSIVVTNSHVYTYHIDRGVKNTKAYISTDAITDTTYDAGIANSTLIFDGQIDQHPADSGACSQTLSLIVAPPTYLSLIDAIIDVEVLGFYDDNFTGEYGDDPNSELWEQLYPSNPIKIQDDSLKLVDDEFAHRGIRSTYKISDDFDFQIDFSNGAPDISYTAVHLRAISSTNYAQTSFVLTTNTQKYMASNDAGFEYSMIVSSIADGGLRLKRVGNDYSFYRKSLIGWSLMATETQVFTDPSIRIEIEWSIDEYYPPFVTSVDNFRLIGGTPYPPLQLQDMALDIEIWQRAITDSSLDIDVFGDVYEDISLDLQAYYRSLSVSQVDINAWQEAAEDSAIDISNIENIAQNSTLDLFAAMGLMDSMNLDVSAAMNSFQNAAMDVCFTDDAAKQNSILDISVTDGNQRQDAKMDVLAVSPTPEFTAVYAMHLNSAIKEVA